MRSYHEQDFYELLELTPEASQGDIEQAYERLKGVFAESSSATFMLFGEDEAASMRERLEEAFQTLSRQDSRIAYDTQMGIERTRPLESTKDTSSTQAIEEPDSETAPVEVAVKQPPLIATPVPAPPPLLVAKPTVAEPVFAEAELMSAPTPAPAALTPPPLRPSMMVESPPVDSASENMEYGGSVLCRIREGRNITLESIAQRTKISMTHLRAIESNTYDKLPARVYVRGFVTQYAKFLGLPADRVADSYLQIYDRFFQNKA